MNQEQQTTEVRDVETRDGGERVRRQTVSQHESADNRVVVARIVWYIAGFIIALLAIRIVLLMLGANKGTGFVDFIYAISGIFAAPFAGIFATPSYGQFFFDTASIVAIVIYALVAWGIAKLIVINKTQN